MLRAAHIIQLTVVALLAVALVMVHSAGMRVGDDQRFSVTSIFTSRHAVYAGLAVAAMGLACRIDIRQFQRLHGWRNPLCWLVLSAIALVGLAMVPGIGRSVRGASRWLYVGPRGWGVSFQPSELLKWIMVLAIAWWCARRCGTMPRFRTGLLPPLLLIGLGCGLVVIEDLGTAVLIALTASLLLFAGGARMWQLMLCIPPAAAALFLAIIQSPYRVARLVAFLDPWADPEGTGYHPIQSMLAIATGGLGGRGLGNGIQKLGYLPEDTTDFLFAIICEELGIGGAALVVALFLVLLWGGFAIARDAKDTFARLFALGVLLTIGLQAVINLAVVTVMLPTKGIALPLLSAGGTGWILTAASLGLVASLDVANRIEAETATTSPRSFF